MPSTASLRLKHNSSNSTSSGKHGGSKRSQLSPGLEMDLEPEDVILDDDEDDAAAILVLPNGDIVEQV